MALERCGCTFVFHYYINCNALFTCTLHKNTLQCITVQYSAVQCSRTAVGLTCEFHLGSILCSRAGYNGCSSGREFTLLQILSGRNVSMLPFCQTRCSGADLQKALSLGEAILMREKKILSFGQCPNQIDLPLLDGGDVCLPTVCGGRDTSLQSWKRLFLFYTIKV